MGQNLSLAPLKWPSQSGIVPSIDGLRGISIILVLVGHLLLPVWLLGVSAIGLNLFFFISGFLIVRLLLAEAKSTGEVDLKQFYIRRLLRLYPVLVFYVIFMLAVKIFRSEPVDQLEIFSIFFYFANYLGIYKSKLGEAFTFPMSMLWSLSVEEHFYLFAPILLVLFRGNAKYMLRAGIVICGTCLALRLSYAYFNPGVVDTLELYLRSETRFDSMAYGLLLACLADLPKGRVIIQWFCKPWVFVLALMIFLGSFLVRENYFQMTWRFSIQGLALMPLVAGLVFSEVWAPMNRLLNGRVLVQAGVLSYSLYIWHMGIPYLMNGWYHLIPPHATPYVLAALSILAAYLSYNFLEKPILSLRRRYGHARLKNEFETPAAQLR